MIQQAKQNCGIVTSICKFCDHQLGVSKQLFGTVRLYLGFIRVNFRPFNEYKNPSSSSLKNVIYLGSSLRWSIQIFPFYTVFVFSLYLSLVFNKHIILPFNVVFQIHTKIHKKIHNSGVSNPIYLILEYIFK